MELVFIRHGQSEWNAKNLFTGWRDVKLSEQGLAEAAAAGQKLKEKGYQFDIAFTSVLTRAIKTCKHRTGRIRPTVGAANQNMAVKRTPLRPASRLG